MVERLFKVGKDWVKKKQGIQELDVTNYRHHFCLVLEGLEEFTVRRPELLLGKIFSTIGFDKIRDNHFRQLSCLITIDR